MLNPAKHHMGERLELVLYGSHQMRMAMTMTGRPPGADRIDEAAAIARLEINTVRADDFQRWQSRLHLRIGHPEVLPADLIQFGRLPRYDRWLTG